MTDSDSQKLDEILKKLEWIGEMLQGLGFSLESLAATTREKKSPAPPLKPLKRR